MTFVKIFEKLKKSPWSSLIFLPKKLENFRVGLPIKKIWSYYTMGEGRREKIFENFSENDTSRVKICGKSEIDIYKAKNT